MRLTGRRRWAKPARCPPCGGVGSWLDTGGEAPPNSTRQRTGDGPWWVHCGGCSGTGWTTFGARAGWLAQRLAPAFGWCLRCGTPWAFVRGHDTPYGGGHGCFPLCEPCWGELTPAERLPFYAQLMDVWKRHAPLEPGTWEAVREAVEAGR